MKFLFAFSTLSVTVAELIRKRNSDIYKEFCGNLIDADFCYMCTMLWEEEFQQFLYAADPELTPETLEITAELCIQEDTINCCETFDY
ncbi:Oidioi.mRNA.OKI2018_I69.chr2.g4561.t1.cds [Oikopleura dioica]|uniref:Oidioi.mRNA.OKI2018_I69.chr2.g4561.t1.cds n=1 Tax=Oikopleura dioica TaxID=34765 RepID=A0ABN7T4B7_OIKDI|nr:Oidioi.mRNA.OKI2018_I69.chr2.g4561.t1.cds [Oikopleura dioica]